MVMPGGAGGFCTELFELLRQGMLQRGCSLPYARVMGNVLFYPMSTHSCDVAQIMPEGPEICPVFAANPCSDLNKGLWWGELVAYQRDHPLGWYAGGVQPVAVSLPLNEPNSTTSTAKPHEEGSAKTRWAHLRPSSAGCPRLASLSEIEMANGYT
jgi:hypothetical protein